MYKRYILLIFTLCFSTFVKAQSIITVSSLKDSLHSEQVAGKFKKENLVRFIEETYKNSSLLYEGKLPENSNFFLIAHNTNTDKESLMSMKELKVIPFNKVVSITFIKEGYVRALYGETVGRYGIFKIKYE